MPSLKEYKNIFRLLIITIICLVVFSQTLVQYQIFSDKFDSTRVNLSGRQRMLSQNLSKEILKIHSGIEVDFVKMKENFFKFTSTHRKLISGDLDLHLEPINSDGILNQFQKLEPSFLKLESILNSTIKSKQISEIELNEFLDTEKDFLVKMDKIVFNLNQESIDKMKTLQWIEISLAILTILVIFFEILFLYKPLFKELTENKESIEKRKNHFEEFSFFLSHKLRNHISRISSILGDFNFNQKEQSLNYIEEIKHSLKKLDKDILDLNKKHNLLIPDLKTLAYIEKVEIKKENLLLIDDDKLTTILTKKIILQREPNLKIIIFNYAKEALMYISELEDKEKLPTIFLDIQMPEMNGWEFLTELEAKKFLCNVYLLSSSVDYFDIQKSKTFSSVKGYLTKPLTIENIPKIVL